MIWHSITQLYWPAEEQAAVESVLAHYGARHPLARISLEFASGDDSSSMPELRTTLWSPGSAPRHRRLGTAHHHGVPVRLAGKCPADRDPGKQPATEPVEPSFGPVRSS